MGHCLVRHPSPSPPPLYVALCNIDSEEGNAQASQTPQSTRRTFVHCFEPPRVAREMDLRQLSIRQEAPILGFLGSLIPRQPNNLNPGSSVKTSLETPQSPSGARTGGGHHPFPRNTWSKAQNSTKGDCGWSVRGLDLPSAIEADNAQPPCISGLNGEQQSSSMSHVVQS